MSEDIPRQVVAGLQFFVCCGDYALNNRPILNRHQRFLHTPLPMLSNRWMLSATESIRHFGRTPMDVASRLPKWQRGKH